MRRTSVLFMTLIASLVILRGQQESGASLAPKPIVPVTASTLTRTPDPYYGEWVSLAGTVDRVLGPLVFTVDQDRNASAGNDVLVFTKLLTAPLEPNSYVTVIGEAVRFDPEALAAKAKDYNLAIPAELAAAYRGRPAILAASIVNNAGVEVTRRLPPPMTPDERALQKIMKQVSSANGTLRKAVEGSNAKLAAENAAILRKAFEETEVFWKRLRRRDAESWAEDAREQAESVERAALRGQWDRVKRAAGELGETCQKCHDTHRERFDDGSFRIRRKGTE